MTDQAVAAILGADPFCRYLGLRPADGPDARDGDLVLPPDDDNVGNHRRHSIHGGIMAAFLEVTAALHVQAAIGEPVSTATFTSEFLREELLVDVVARPKTVRRGRRFVIVRVHAWQESPDRLVACGEGTFVVGAQEGPPDANAGLA